MHGSWESSSSWSSMGLQEAEDWQLVSLSPEICTKEGSKAGGGVAEGRQRKRRRTRSLKNKEEVENQRMTHIAVERNRRKQMNEYLATLRRLMPPSYVQRYSSTTSCNTDGIAVTTSSSGITNETTAERRLANADIEVTMVEGHANLKILAKRRPKQLLKLVAGLNNLRLMTLHLNVTTVEHFVLYCFSLKVEEECKCASVDDMATAVYQLVAEIQEEVALV
ncbi:hypothetical protein J5N97_003003 [Dioscorea zingiberensis]|uniref:BHLH domain-containing protein n=1 Tax=Dioscorea zingiberensis TaxID=325984 RepID=A0A9D5HQW1_9LILI|nr:hypothetical protein J5N97_003003 [Dioscorea zingiberensis]